MPFLSIPMNFDVLLSRLHQLEVDARAGGFDAFAYQVERFRVACNYNRGAFDPKWHEPAKSKPMNTGAAT